MLAVTAPAAGAPTVQILIATLLAGVVTVALLALAHSHLSGRSQRLRRAGDRASRALGIPPWAALPTAVAGLGLTLGGFGVFWDIALHLGEGRDQGPLANPSHYLILAALYACFAGGVLSVALHHGTDTPARRPVRLPGGLSGPVGGVLLLACGAFALAGFPLDDLWHRMFGQDVTLWGPTHLVMINGAILSVPSLAVLGLEARRATTRTSARGAARTSLAGRLPGLVLPAALLFSVAFWATEFDWGLPQYRLVWQPLLLAAASAFALVSGRVVLGGGGALLTVAVFLALRGATHLGVDLLGVTAPATPLFVAEALLVEAAFLLRRRRSPVTVGVLAGLLCGTAGFAAEYAWTTIAMPIAWSPALLPEAVPTAAVAGVAGGALGALLGAALTGVPLPRAARRRSGVLAGCALAVLGANALWTTEPETIRAAVSVDEGVVTARIDPPSAARDAEWLTATAWQGGGIVVRPLRETAPGTWRSTGPVPLGGRWKTALRLQQGRALVSLPLHLPADEAVPFAGVSRPPRFSASFVPDLEVMQTERRDFVPGWLWTPAALLMLVFCALFCWAIAAGLVRASEPGRAVRRRPGRPQRRRRAPADVAERVGAR